ncbi:MAG: hypothetical protein L0213_10795, partial [Candidatus Dadabacteria bacterium]|nr:hypothetical protein [Candidatus Dadabacteria bacterium]
DTMLKCFFNGSKEYKNGNYLEAINRFYDFLSFLKKIESDIPDTLISRINEIRKSVDDLLLTNSILAQLTNSNNANYDEEIDLATSLINILNTGDALALAIFWRGVLMLKRFEKEVETNGLNIVQNPDTLDILTNIICDFISAENALKECKNKDYKSLEETAKKNYTELIKMLNDGKQHYQKEGDEKIVFNIAICLDKISKRRIIL